MKLNKKAFTLVEVLAVVAILAILATLIIPSVTKYLKGGKEDYDENLKKQLILVAKNYYAENRDRLPKNSGSISSYVTLKELISLKYTSKDFIDSKGNNCNNDSYVTAWLNDDSDNIDYYACMKCGEEKYYDDEDKCKLQSNTDPDDPEKPVDNSITCEVTNIKETNDYQITITSENLPIQKIKVKKPSKNIYEDLVDVTTEKNKNEITTILETGTNYGNYSVIANNSAKQVKCPQINNKEKSSTITAKIDSKMYFVSAEQYEKLKDKGRIENIESIGTPYDGSKWKSGYVYVDTKFKSSDFKTVKVVNNNDNTNIKSNIKDNKYFWITPEGTTNFTIIGVDISGNTNNKNKGTVKLDRTPPEIGNIVNSVNGLWTRFDVTITAYATDKISGVNKIVYGTADHEKTTNDYSGKWTSEQGFKTKNAKAIKEWKAADRDISMFIEAVDEAGNKAITCNSLLNGHCYTNIRQDVTAPTININDPNDKWHCGRGISGNGYNCDIYVYYFHDNLSGVYKMKHGHCYNGYNCTDYSGAKAKLDSKTLETRTWPDSGFKRIEYCMNAGYTAYIYFEVCDRVDNCATFGPYTDKVNDSPACTALG
mgnify:FL=1